MADLTAAHRGYEYQDLLTAARLVDVILCTVLEARVDEKLVADDRFDDLTTVDAAGHRERTQFKHTEQEGQPLTLATFTRDARSLRLDQLVAVALADRDGPGVGARDSTFRVVLRDARPVEKRLLAVLEPASPDPGPFLHGMSSLRMRFNFEALWHGSSMAGTEQQPDANPFAFLRHGDTALARADLEWACERIVIEVEAPAASRDLTAPGPAERLLLTRVHDEIGAALYPNADRSAVDVAEALIRAARSARQGGPAPTGEELLRRARIRHDFGAVAHVHPVDRTVEVSRPLTVGDLAQAAASAADEGQSLLVVGPPGQGKSWVCQQVIEELAQGGWLVAEHYCYLGDADGDLVPRVLAESVFGSLLARLAESDSRLVVDQRPRFAADPQALAQAVERALGDQPDGRVALIVDGIDHVTRVQGGGPTSDPSFALAEALGSLDLPRGSVLIVLSQPGRHLRPLEDAGAVTVHVPGLSGAELRQLAERLGIVPGDETPSTQTQSISPLSADDDGVADFFEALSERSSGNALYATYLCREALLRLEGAVSPSETVRSLPAFDGSLENYYRHLQKTLGDRGAWVADVIALLDFPVTAAELKEIMPDRAPRVDGALTVLKPVIVERAGQGGVRIYHESFARFLRQPFHDDPTARVALLDRIAAWLRARGILEDSRSFRFLLPTLAEANHDREVVDTVGHGFVVQAVAAGFPASAIISNLATAIGCAGRVGDWPAIVRYVEMSRAAETYQEERFDSTMVDFADVPMALLGGETVAARLLHDGRPVMAARAGLQMCAAADALGAFAPWSEYMTAYMREAKHDNTSYGEASDRQVSLAWLRGRLRLSSGVHGAASQDVSTPAPAATGIGPDDSTADSQLPNLVAPINWAKVADGLEQQALPVSGVIDAVLDTYDLSAVVGLIQHLAHPGSYCLALAEGISVGRISGSQGSSRLWASAASGHGLPPGSTHRLIALGIGIGQIALQEAPEAQSSLLGLTRDVQDPSVRWNTDRLGRWLDACCVAARRDPLGLDSAEALLAGPGWYPCWLRFTVGLVRAEAAPAADQAGLSLDALHLLTGDLNPFSGEPRACDLYPVQDTINDTIRRALTLLDDHAWGKALHLLDTVSGSIATTLRGEQGGPVSREGLLRLAAETATPTRRAAAEALIKNEIENGAGGRFYADLAEYHLLAARLALTAGDHDEAERLWIDACRMLTAYGWHKDITIYELLDPLPALIEADPARGRGCVAKLQPLCERVPLHTDGRDTRGAWWTWWALLAAADPVSLARIAAPALLRDCNNPSSLLHDARSELWRTWHHEVDPIVAGALRLTLEEPLNAIDHAAISDLADIADGSGSDAAARLLTLLMARIDERSFRYGVTNSDELLDRDAEWVDEANSVADRASVPRVVPIPRTDFDADKEPALSNDVAASAPLDAFAPVAGFPPGAVGIAQAIREWRGRRYDEAGRDGAAERFANILGYRMVELAEGGREEEAAGALESIADSVDFGDRAGLLDKLAEGLERNHQPSLATVASTLAWTRARGHGGWLTFGGKTGIESLRRAADLDRSLALRTITQETQRIVAGGYGTLGVSQALIHGFAGASLLASAEATLSVAFQAWDEAFTVIVSRAPRVSPADDPSELYAPPDPDDGTETPGDVNAALAVAALAGLAHPSREQKRRSLVAAQFLLNERTTEAVPAFRTALLNLSDPATLMWLQRMLELAGEIANPVIADCIDVLAGLAGGPHLTVRALARRLLGDHEVPSPPAARPDPALLGPGPSGLWTPDNVTMEGDESGANELIREVAGARLSNAEPILPGLRDAVRMRVTETIASKDYEKRVRAQLREYADQSERRCPDAYLAPEEAVEDALQLAAAGGRAARLANGLPLSDPVGWEDELATALLDDPMLPVSLEATRHPRLEGVPPPSRGDPLWSVMRTSAEGGRTGDQVEAAVQDGGFLRATLAVASAETAPLVEAGRFDGWRLLATVERRFSPSSDRSGQPDSIAERYRAVEVQDPDSLRALDVPPVTEGSIRAWVGRCRFGSSPDGARESQPILGIDFGVVGAGDARYGLGVQVPLLTPTPWLMATLGLHQGGYFVLDDKIGPALALITWRTEYETSEYYLSWPRLCGAAVVVRDDLFERLVNIAGARLVLRDFVLGDATLST